MRTGRGRFSSDPAFTLTLAEAFEVQRQVAALRAARGEAVAGYKIGCISEAVQRQLGLDRPAFGHIFATELHPSGAVLDARAFDGLAIEGEFAVRIGGDLSIASVFPVIELHNNVFRGPVPTSQELIANNALHAGVVLPPVEIPCPDPRATGGRDDLGLPQRRTAGIGEKRCDSGRAAGVPHQSGRACCVHRRRASAGPNGPDGLAAATLPRPVRRPHYGARPGVHRSGTFRACLSGMAYNSCFGGELWAKLRIDPKCASSG